MFKVKHNAALLVALLMSSGVAMAQNCEMQHKDGTTTFTTRGGNNAVACGIYQRYPADQICGAQALKSFNMILQDQIPATNENFVLAVRGNDAAGPATGSPDITATGVLGSATFTNVSFGTSTTTAAAAFITITFTAPGLPLAFAGSGAVPADDIYCGADLPQTTGTNPNWPTDGCSTHANATSGTDLGEQFRATAVGYTGVAGVAGMGWGINYSTSVKALSAGNRSYSPAIRPAQDVLQPFADNAAVFVGGTTAGLNPNFGYAGIFPDLVRGDGFGVRLRSNAPVGSAVIPVFDIATIAPQNFGVDGNLCVNAFGASAIILPTLVTVAPGALPPLTPSHTSELIIGPFAFPSLAGIGNLYGQMGTLDSTATGGVRLSTIARINL